MIIFLLLNISLCRTCYGLHLSPYQPGIFSSLTEKGFTACAFLIIGMTFFLILCTVFPNGQNLRPATFVRDNIFVDLVRYIYSTDTPTNVLPSIHVFNSIGGCIAIGHSKALKKHRKIQFGSYLLALLIILSTMFLKQHSVTDVIAAFVLSCVSVCICRAGEEGDQIIAPANLVYTRFEHFPRILRTGIIKIHFI